MNRKSQLMYEAFNAYWNERNLIKFPWHWDYFELNYTETFTLYEFAKLFGISAKPEKSHARTLWERLKAYHDSLPF